MAFFQHRAWYSVSQLHMQPTVAYLVTGVAGLVAVSMSMAAGEYVSVHSQADTEKAELELERKELKAGRKGEQRN